MEPRRQLRGAWHAGARAGSRGQSPRHPQAWPGSPPVEGAGSSDLDPDLPPDMRTARWEEPRGNPTAEQRQGWRGSAAAAEWPTGPSGGRRCGLRWVVLVGLAVARAHGSYRNLAVEFQLPVGSD